ncbi:Protein PP2a_WBT-like [Oopsacas minuta]|uniref:Serine/threonine protein phosphatase 2A regulatory subunit n=1 Tax=Oopsacas minuta TaxID=111878 RepID=A0AAV7JJF5_9METZ|nr:Protein PP2a_WBT-like [Oopsacas minuta]
MSEHLTHHKSKPKNALSSHFISKSKADRLHNGQPQKRTSQSGSYIRTITSPQRDMPDLPLLKDSSPDQSAELLKKKLALCSLVFNFMDASSDLRAKEVKRACLNELIEYMSSNRGVLSEAVYQPIISMVAINVLRSLPPNEREEFDPDEDEPTLEASWSHLQLVYEFFVKFLEYPDFNPQLAKKYVNQNFVVQLLDLFDSEDPRERDYLKTVLHRIYGKFLGLRAFIRKQVNNIFLRYTFEIEKFFGIAELLEILGSIINGFALPLRSEHKTFLQKVLVPLHKPKSLYLYHPQLTYCIIQFLEKDSTLTESVVQGILRLWPRTCSSKEVMLLNELEEILDVIDPSQFVKIQALLFTRISQCVQSPHFQVSERALYFWNNDYVFNLIEENVKPILPIMYGPLVTAHGKQWNANIIEMIANVLKSFRTMDSQLYDKLEGRYRDDKQTAEKKLKERAFLWEKLEGMALRK